MWAPSSLWSRKWSTICAWRGRSEKENGSTSDVDAWLAGWINRNFSGGHGDEMAGILNDFTQLTNVRKIENLDNDTFFADRIRGRGSRAAHPLQRDV